MTTRTFQRKCHVHFLNRDRHMRRGPKPELRKTRIPRISKLVALAIHFDDMVLRGQIEDYATIADLSQLSRARISQIMYLARLAPDIQTELLFLPRTPHGRDWLNTTNLEPICKEMNWRRQRQMWQELKPEIPAHVFTGEEDEGARPSEG